MKFDSEMEELFYKRFNQLNLKYTIPSKEFLIKAVRPQMSERLPFDFYITIGAIEVAVIELKSTQYLKIFDYSRIDTYASENDIRFYVLSDGEQFIVTDRNKGFEKVILNFNQFVDKIIERKQVNLNDIKYRVADIIKELIMESKFKFLKDHFDNLHQSILDELVYDEINQRFYFDSFENINNVENKIFRLLLKDDKPLRKIYRYTTLSTIYSCLKYNTYRINCLVGMNDTTEVNYAENFVFGTNKDFTKANWKRVETYNNRFISSCSLKKDDLTQWRLYADDSKGICLELKVINEKLEGKFILKRISYGKRGGAHPELELIKTIRSRLNDELNINFDFKTLNTWKHFFKPHDYAVEQEVRLLYIHDDNEFPKKDWLLTTSHNILNPFVEFKLNDPDMPLHLTKIVLGPKCPENQINKKQFQQYIRDLRNKPEYILSDVEVGLSTINNYR